MCGLKSHVCYITLLFALLLASFGIKVSRGITCFPFFKKGKGTLRLLFASPSYYVYRCTCCFAYVHRATNDDIASNKYIFLDLYSLSHHNAIVQIPMEDDRDNGRHHIISYEIDHTLLPVAYQNATIGAVWFFTQLLDKQHDYVRRSVMTYKDDLNRFCVSIETFDASGSRISLYIYRAKRKTWWLKKVLENKASGNTSLLGMLGFTSRNKSPEPKQVLNIITSNCPLGMANHRSSGYDIIYNNNPGKDTGNISEIVFRSAPEYISPNTTDLFVWRYHEEDHDNITYVVIAEVFYDYMNLKYYRCISFANKQYALIDSFAAYGDYIKPTESPYADIGMPTEDTKLILNHKKTREHMYQPGLIIIAYPDCHHYIVRPMSDGKLKVITGLDYRGQYNNLELKAHDMDAYTFLTLTDASDTVKKRISLASLGNNGFTVDGGLLSLTVKEPSIASRADQHMVAMLKHQLSVHYLPLHPEVMLHRKKSIEFKLDRYNDSEVLAAQVNATTTFFTPNLYGSIAFRRFKVDKKRKIKLNGSYNTQVMYMESDGRNFVMTFQAGVRDVGVYEITPDRVRRFAKKTKLKILKNNEMSAYYKISTTEEDSDISYVTLDFNVQIFHRNIEVLVISTDVTIYVPFSKSIRISSVTWGSEKLSFDPSNDPIITVITSSHASYLLVDDLDVENGFVKRYLYRMETKPRTKLRIIAQSSAEFDNDSLNSIRLGLQDTWYDLIPERLPMLTDYGDHRVGNVRFDYHNLTILFMPYYHEFTLGNLKVGQRVLESIPDHRWRQVHKREEDGTVHFVYTMGPDGITEEIAMLSMEEFEGTTTPYVRTVYPPTQEGAIPLLLDSYTSSDVKVLISTVGKTTLNTLKPARNGETFNPVIFGHHEIHFLNNFECTQVVLSHTSKSVREVNLDVKSPDGVRGMLTFGQSADDPELYELHHNDDHQIDFVDLNRPMYYYETYFHKHCVLDFNKGLFPHYVRYLTLNADTMYFTGHTVKGGLKILFEQYELLIPHEGAVFHIWVRYPNHEATGATMYARYEHDQVVTKYYTVENTLTMKRLRRPSGGNCNWGPLSNMEFHIVNSILARRVMARHELDTVDLVLKKSKRDHRILELKVDDVTTLYTTLATSESVIGNVEYKGVFIKGVPKQLVKHVYVSRSATDEIVLILARTVKSLVAKAYRFTNAGAFESVDHRTVDAERHATVHGILKSIA